MHNVCIMLYVRLILLTPIMCISKKVEGLLNLKYQKLLELLVFLYIYSMYVNKEAYNYNYV